MKLFEDLIVAIGVGVTAGIIENNMVLGVLMFFCYVNTV